MAICPDGHDSTATDYCDVCGLQIIGAPVPAAVASPAAATEPGEPCPVCGEPRTGRFCEGCSYDFVSGAGGTPQPAPTPVETPVVVEPVAPTPTVTPAWTARVFADRAHYDVVQADADPEVPEIPFPAFCPEREFTLSGTQVRIGRRSRSQGLEPEIDLTGPPADPGISHLHAILVPADEGWSVVDPGSVNGVTVNDNPDSIAVDIPVPLRDGDRIHLGAWTTIALSGPTGESQS